MFDLSSSKQFEVCHIHYNMCLVFVKVLQEEGILYDCAFLIILHNCYTKYLSLIQSVRKNMWDTTQFEIIYFACGFSFILFIFLYFVFLFCLQTRKQKYVMSLLDRRWKSGFNRHGDLITSEVDNETTNNILNAPIIMPTITIEETSNTEPITVEIDVSKTNSSVKHLVSFFENDK